MMSTQSELRRNLKDKLIIERRIYENGCEGRHYKTHVCDDAFHMSETLFPRNTFQSLNQADKNYFWHSINCTILCGIFHTAHGHTRKFREWWEEVRLLELGFTREEIDEFISNAPLRIKA